MLSAWRVKIDQLHQTTTKLMTTNHNKIEQTTLNHVHNFCTVSYSLISQKVTLKINTIVHNLHLLNKQDKIINYNFAISLLINNWPLISMLTHCGLVKPRGIKGLGNQSLIQVMPCCVFGSKPTLKHYWFISKGRHADGLAQHCSNSSGITRVLC